MSSLIPQALFLVYNQPLKRFVEHLFRGNSSIRIEDLSEEQLPIFNLPLNRTYIVKGGPGTGKTLMSYFRANRVARDGPPVQTWHEWLWAIIKKLERNPKEFQYKDYEYNWELVAHLFEKEVYPTKDQKCYLFLDEAQDFPKELAKILSKCFDTVTIFIDEHQAIDRTTKVHEIRQIFDVESNPYPLSKNYRNTPEVFEVARLFFTGDPGLLPEETHMKRSGQKPRIISNYSFQDSVDVLVNYINNFPHKIVGVVLPNWEIKENYYEALCAKRPKVNVQQYKRGFKDNGFSLDGSGLKLLTINTVKGLEFDTVFICDVDSPLYRNISMENEEGKKLFNRLYVACSRAKTELIFTCKNNKVDTFILNILNKNGDLLENTYGRDSFEEVDVPF